jgi:hypothetical protein
VPPWDIPQLLNGNNMMEFPSNLSKRAPAIVAAITLLSIAVLIPAFRLETEMTWPHAVGAAITFVLPCALLGWLVWHILMLRNQVFTPVRAIIFHTMAGLAFSALWTASFSVFVYLLHPPGSVSNMLSESGVWQFLWGVLIYSAIALTARMRKQLKEKEQAADGAELQALRAQLNPHFLFNTLHSLTQLAREDPDATQDALQSFGDLMRYVLNAGRDANLNVSLEDEIEFIHNYLALEKLRLGDRLRIVEDIDPDALELAVPPLLLQPLIENAIRHGIAPRREGGTLQLFVRITEPMLSIEVTDDGNGSKPHMTALSGGLGLKAVQRQIRAFSPDSEVLIENRPGSGFSVQVRIPACIPQKSR